MKQHRYYWIYSLFLGTIALIFFSNAIMKNAGGPPYNTGAPSEKTCSTGESGNACHGNGVPVDNSGPGTPQILFGGGINYYVPGQTYSIKPTIGHPTRNRFGFQIVALKNSDNTNAGTFVLADTTRVRMQSPTWGCCQDRWYVMHQYAGSFTQTPNLGEWTFNWTAPPADEGPITFYAAFLAANNNGLNDSLDETYTTSFTINPSATGLSESSLFEASVKVYPNPIGEVLILSYKLTAPSEVTIALYDIKGSASRQLLLEQQPEGSHTRIFESVDELPPGIYCLTINSRLGTVHKKVILYR